MLFFLILPICFGSMKKKHSDASERMPISREELQRRVNEMPEVRKVLPDSAKRIGDLYHWMQELDKMSDDFWEKSKKETRNQKKFKNLFWLSMWLRNFALELRDLSATKPSPQMKQWYALFQVI